MTLLPSAPEAWRVSLACSKAAADAIPFDIPAFSGLEPTPVVLTTEPDAAYPDSWRLDILFAEEPAAEHLDAVIALVPGSARSGLIVTPIYPDDWVTMSQHLEPLTAGRFHIYTQTARNTLRPHHIGLRIEAGQAFGTGQHATTSGCLLAIDRLARSWRPKRVLDLGTGSGILAFASLKCWHAQTIASDIDPISTQVARENARINAIPQGIGPHRLECLTAAGLHHRRLRANAPYDLIIANILAGPLIKLAQDITPLLAPGGWLILAGLLDSQEKAVCQAYFSRGLVKGFRHQIGDWPTVSLRKPLKYK